MLMPAVLAGVLLGGLAWVVLFYAALYSLSCLIVISRLVLEVERSSRRT